MILGKAQFPTTKNGVYGGSFCVICSKVGYADMLYKKYGSDPTLYLSDKLEADKQTAISCLSAYQAVCDLESDGPSRRAIFMSSTLPANANVYGASCGIAACLAMMGMKLSPKVCFTGSVQKLGNTEKGMEGLRNVKIGPVSGVPQKLEGCLREGIMLVAPAGNRMETSCRYVHQPYGIDKEMLTKVAGIIWVETMGDVLDVIEKMGYAL